MKLDILPKDLDEALEILTNFYSQHIQEIIEMPEKEFIGSTHFMSGMFIRNTWFLWWFPNNGYKGWPETQPPLNAWFETIGITHADDMSSILLTCLHRSLTGKEYDLDKQVEHYKKHWKKNGYPDGIPRHK